MNKCCNTSDPISLFAGIIIIFFYKCQVYINFDITTPNTEVITCYCRGIWVLNANRIWTDYGIFIGILRKFNTSCNRYITLNKLFAYQQLSAKHSTLTLSYQLQMLVTSYYLLLITELSIEDTRASKSDAKVP